MKKAIRIIIFFAIGIGLILWFLSKMTKEEMSQMLASFEDANYFWFFLAIVINVLSVYIRAVRWRQLLRPMQYNPNLNATFLAVITGYLANLAVPRLGEFVRCAMLRKHEKVPFEKAVGTVVVERIVDTLLFMLIMLVAMLLEFDYIKSYVLENFSSIINFHTILKIIILFVVLGIIAFVLFFIFKRKLSKNKLYIKVKSFVRNFIEGIKSVFKLKQPLIFVLHSLAIWFLWILGTYIIFMCIGETSSLTFKTAVITTVLGAIGPMLTPGGIGIFPLIIAQTLLVYHIAEPVGYASGWLLWISSQIGSIVIGLIGFIYFAKSKKTYQQTDEQK